ncbi:hypothetical protein H6G96_07570 [Nostoc sp. FACHB-892]|uniref:hypothetical protein n=1 Tax=Nostoc sp. FACHB-892 TaxID=2692843 RepID=UPI0016872832|nr:hypothetical protein [Nostoc sp. FACHB-892]MBD2726186.1 hypothetical protein [Nostoc sp. FACHB-892]
MTLVLTLLIISFTCWHDAVALGIHPGSIKRGAIIGACKIIHCRQADFDNYAYQLMEAFEFKNPIDCADLQSIF